MMGERVDGEVPLHLEARGDGPTLLLMHGFGGSARNFRPQARAFHDRFRVAAFDLRGHARSGAPDDPGAYAPDRFVEDVTRILDHLRVERALLGGLSMGAGIALRFTLAHPERVRGLLLAAPPPGARERHQARWAREFAAAIEREGLERAGEQHVWGAQSSFDPEAARLVRMGFLEHPPHGLAHALRELLAEQPAPADLAPQLADLNVPTLVVVGAADPISRRVAEAFARAYPSAKLVVVEGAGHVVNLTNPKLFNAALETFLDEVLAN